MTWNGHGDALALWRIETSGALTLANSYTYTTWGKPTTMTHNGYPDLALRYLYVGRQGVAWDGALGLELALMGARHYSPSLGRFVQPDPSALETNPYAYAENSPVTKVDPDGRFFWFVAAVVVRVAIAAAPLVVRLAPATTRIAPVIAYGARTAAALGVAGERAVRAAYNIGPKVAINVSGRIRIPDGLNTCQWPRRSPHWWPRKVPTPGRLVS